MNRVPVLPLVAGGYVAGTIGGAILGGSWLLTLLLGTLLVGTLLLAAPANVRTRTSTALVAAIVIAAGVASFAHWRIDHLDAQPPPPLAAMTGTHEVVGIARADAVLRGSMQRVDIDVETVDGVPFEGGVRISGRVDRGLATVGDRIRIVVALDRPPAVEAFDYAAYLRDRDIHLVGTFPREWEYLGATDRGWRGSLEEFHRTVVRRIEQTMPEPHASLSSGVLVGERATLPEDIDEALRATGTTHLVVVSGQNVALLVGIAVAALTAFVSRRLASVIALAFLPAYIVFVGADPPVVRAGIMAVAVVAAGVTGRRTPGWVYLTYAAGLMLAVEPRLVRDVAFQLSATATAGITTLSPALRDATIARFPALATSGRSALVGISATATGAAVAVLPVQVAAFGVVAPWTVVANILVAPIYEATVAVAALSALLGGGGILGTALAVVPGAFLALVEVLAALPAAQIPVTLPLVAGLAFTGIIVVLTSLIAGYARRNVSAAVLDGGLSPHFATTTGLAIVAIGLWWGALAPSEVHPSVTVLDVGQGLAVLVRDGETTLLIDTGPPDAQVLAALGRRDIGSLDAIVLTHDDLDHTGALGRLLDRVDVGDVYVEASTTGRYATRHPVQPIDIGDRLTVGRVTVEVLAPPARTRDHRLRSDNDGSLVLMVTLGERRILVTGDIEAAGEAWLLASGLDLRADVLVVPHHGSNSSSTTAFIEAVVPSVAVIPVGRNPYGHPHPDVLERYASDPAISIYRTDDDGAVTLRSDGARLWLTTGR